MKNTTSGSEFRSCSARRSVPLSLLLLWPVGCGTHSSAPDQTRDAAQAGMPETIWEPSSQQFMVYWSTALDSDPSASDPHSIYLASTHR